jgi:two-component system sensor histidine kinase RegB
MSIGLTSQSSLSARNNLRDLSIIRVSLICVQALALAMFSQFYRIGLPVEALCWVLSGYSVVAVFSWQRTRQVKPINDFEFFLHLLVDMFFFSLLLYFSGGASNPFISYYLIPISISAITLPRRSTLLVTVAGLMAYSILLQYYVEIAAIAPSVELHSGNNLHITGMWVNFGVSAAIITYFVSRMSLQLKSHQLEIAEQREAQLRSDQILAVGTLAAGTAHELGTPLNTMKILVDEILERAELPERDDMLLLHAQIEQCKTTLKQLICTAEQSQSDALQAQRLELYFQQLFERWQLMRPNLKANIHLPQASATTHMDQVAVFDPTIAQSLLNILNNAADANPLDVEVTLRWSVREVQLSIRDHGPGLAPHNLESLGDPFVTDKADGLGLGLFLSRATLNRFGASIRVQNAAGGGLLTEIVLPLSNTAMPRKKGL